MCCVLFLPLRSFQRSYTGRVKNRFLMLCFSLKYFSAVFFPLFSLFVSLQLTALEGNAFASHTRKHTNIARHTNTQIITNETSANYTDTCTRAFILAQSSTQSSHEQRHSDASTIWIFRSLQLLVKTQHADTQITYSEFDFWFFAKKRLTSQPYSVCRCRLHEMNVLKQNQSIAAGLPATKLHSEFNKMPEKWI